MPLFLMAISIAVQTAIMVAILYLAHYLRISRLGVRVPHGAPQKKSLENALFYRDSRLFVLLKSSFVFFSNQK